MKDKFQDTLLQAARDNTKHFVELFCYDGSSYNEVESRDVEVSIPDYAYGYRFFDRVEMEVGGETLKGGNKNFSTPVYVGEIYDEERVRSEITDEYRLENLLHSLGNTRGMILLKTTKGRFKEIEGDSIVIPSKAESRTASR